MGDPFQEIFAAYDNDFYKIDKHLFSPAVVELVNVDTGVARRFGEFSPKVLEASLRHALSQIAKQAFVGHGSFGRGPSAVNITFLGSADSWYLRDLRSAQVATAFTITPAAFSKVASSIDPSDITVTAGHAPPPTTDCVLVRTMPPGSLEQVVFRMDALASWVAGGTLVVNPPKAIEAAVDKYLTTSRLAGAGLLVPRTITCQTAEAGMEAFAKLGGDVVLKPIFGGEGRGITRLADEALARASL